MTTFSVYTMDGQVRVFDDNAEGFLARWQVSLVDPGRQWPVAYLKTLDGSEQAVHFNPFAVVTVAVRLEDG